MTNKTVEQQRANRLSSKEDRERDAASAMQEYEAEKAAVLARTAKLRAMRLARESAAQTGEQAVKAKKVATTEVAPKKPRAAAAKNKAPKR